MTTIEELKGNIYFACTACMSVWSDALSWANAFPERVTINPKTADNIIILSCQVTDLAILNDIHTAECYQKEFPLTKIFISGCLAQRTDIELPKGIERLNQMKCDYQQINDKNLVHYEKPFWVKDFQENSDILSAGNLFRNMYPMRIGKGCPFNCTYCTIKTVRGKHETYDIDERTIEEFISHDDIVIIADCPTVKQINDWCWLAIEKNKQISLRNIEPQILFQSKEIIDVLVQSNLLKILHVPIQHDNILALKSMNRSVDYTLWVMEYCKELRKLGVITATNIIIDYLDYPNPVIEDGFDYISWNPYWDGVWDIKKAEKKYQHYFGKD